MRLTLVHATVASLVLASRPAAAQRIDAAAVTQHARRVTLSAGARDQRITPVVARDSISRSHKRATVIGGVVGAVVGGLAGTAIGINQNAYDCVTVGPACPRKPDRTLLYALAGLIGGGTLGAWLVHSVLLRE